MRGINGNVCIRLTGASVMKRGLVEDVVHFEYYLFTTVVYIFVFIMCMVNDYFFR